MAEKHSSRRARRPSKKGKSSATPRRSEPSRSATIPKAIRVAINAERRELQKASSMLGCLWVALEYGYDGDATEEPSYSDVVRVIRSIVDASEDRLEPLNLERRPVDQDALALEDTD